MTSARQRTKKRQRTTQRSKSYRTQAPMPMLTGDWYQQSQKASRQTLSYAAESLPGDSEQPTEIIEMQGGIRD